MVVERSFRFYVFIAEPDGYTDYYRNLLINCEQHWVGLYPIYDLYY